MAFEVADIQAQFRRKIADPELPGSGDSTDSLISNDDILIFMDDAQTEFCERVDAIPDSQTFSLAITAGTALYTLDERITRLRRGELASTGGTLQAVTIEEMDEMYYDDDYGIARTASWTTDTGVPQFMVTDMEFGKVRLTPIPAENDTLSLWVYRIPLKRIYDGEELEIQEKYRRHLLLKMMALAYSDHDNELFNEGKAIEYEMRWQNALDEVNRQVKRKTRGPQLVRYGGIY